MLLLTVEFSYLMKGGASCILRVRHLIVSIWSLLRPLFRLYPTNQLHLMDRTTTVWYTRIRTIENNKITAVDDDGSYCKQDYLLQIMESEPTRISYERTIRSALGFLKIILDGTLFGLPSVPSVRVQCNILSKKMSLSGKNSEQLRLTFPAIFLWRESKIQNSSLFNFT